MERGLGALAAVVTWLAWLAISPTLGFPTVGTGAMVNRMISRQFPEAGHNPGFWLGWVIVIAGLGIAIAAFFVIERTHLVPNGLRTGLLYGSALWLVTGLVIMPLIGLTEPLNPFAPKIDPMQATLMMYSLGPLAALAALIAWLLFGAILGATAYARQ
jgi:hypothetical protein